MARTALDLWLRIKYSFYGTLIYLLVTNPMTYRFTDRIFGGMFDILRGGLPTPAGYFFHALLFFAFTLGIMMFPRDA